jgi:hypothetical protein
MLLGFRGGLALLQFGRDLFQDLRMLQQIVLHDLLDLAAQRVVEALGRGLERRAAQGKCQSGRGEKAEGAHR